MLWTDQMQHFKQENISRKNEMKSNLKKKDWNNLEKILD